jgi:amino acid adenylation domain-containing protein
MSEIAQYNEYETIRPGLDIAVIGMAGRFPGANNIHEFWNNLKNGVESIAFFSDHELIEAGVSTEELKMTNYVKAKGVLEDIEYFDASFFGYSPREAEKMDPQIRVLHECVWHALEDAGYDPYAYEGAIGFYVGAQNNVYWQARVLLAGMGGASETFNLMHLIDKDHISTHISYKLNLTGPSFALVTQCSTSLVAVHLACQGLISRECDIALAGGISITMPQEKGYHYQEGMILSEDGHLRAFDAKGKGTVFGSGAGIVVLKPIEEAIADGDNMMAVIKSTFINNDGSRKVGYAAPSVEGQAEAVKAAIKLAEVESESIGYMEAHGTATPLGDTIETEALKLAFNTDKTHFCRIGTAKTNVGHLENAAGAAALIKTVLALKHKLIPPSLHFETPNPEIDFENSPFIVNRESTTWESDRHPLRAGVSSFGIGGTNAHVILEEAPQNGKSVGQWVSGSVSQGVNGQRTDGRGGSLCPPLKSRDYQLILLSAQTETALDKMSENLAEYFKKNLLNCGNHENPINPGPILADAAYTLQVGRRGFKYRRALVCRSIEDAVDALTPQEVPHHQLPSTGKAPRAHVQTFFNSNDNRSLFFMFPGLGSEYVNMGRELYEQEPVFREEMNRCFEILEPLMSYDIKEILYPGVIPPLNSPLERGAPEGRGVSNINHFEVAQVVMFIFEYALAQLIMAWGIRPHGMIGYSFGEYTAACISGVFSLEDALRLIVYRGQLIRETAEEGAMLSVPVPVEELKPLLPGDLSIAVDNGSSCIISGAKRSVDAFENQLRKKKCLCVRLDTSYAVHSQMMEPLAKEFEKKLSEITVNHPQIPYISNVTGQYITEEETADPCYWSRHLRQTVRFADGIKELVKEEGAVFVEIGPGRDLSSLVLRYLGESSDQHIVNLVRHSQKNVSDVYYLLGKIGNLWFYGITPNWSHFYSGEKKRRIPLPPYPFERERYWVEYDPFKEGFNLRSQKSSSGKKPDIADWFYLPQWERSQVTPSLPYEIQGKKKSYWLVFMNDLNVCSQLVKRLQEEGQELILVKKGSSFSIKGDQQFTINPVQRSDYFTLMDKLQRLDKVPVTIVHLWGLSHGHYKELEKEMINDSQVHGLYSILYLVQAISKKSFTEKFRIDIVTNHLHEVIGEEVLFPGKATVLALVRTVQQEIVNIKCRCIDIVLPVSRGPQEKKLVEQLANEFFIRSSDIVIAYRGNYRWVETYKPIRLAEVEGEIPRLKERGVYLITGGLGNVGNILAKYLAKTFKAKLILTGRTTLPPRTQWESYLAAYNENEKNRISWKIRKVLELEKMGSEVLTFGADIADEKQMQKVITGAEDRFGSIDGIVHAAGVAGMDTAQPVDSLGKAEFEQQFRPKVYGLLVLEKLFRARKLDFCLLISSPASILGGLGYTPYAAANIFIDSFAHWFNRNNLTQWIAVNWADWEPEEKNDEHDANRGYVGEILMTPEQGIKTFQRILNYYKGNQVIVSAGDFQDRIDKWVKLESLIIEDQTPGKKTGTLKPRPNLTEPYVPPGNPIEKALVDIWNNFFGFERIGIHDDFFELGGDSLKAITIISILHKQLNIKIPLEKFFNCSTIKEVSKFAGGVQSSEHLAIELVEKKEYYPLSSAQKRLYILQQLVKNNVVYNETIVSLLEGELDIKKVEEVLTTLTNRHEILRTSMEMRGDEPVQRVLSAAGVKAAFKYVETNENKAKEWIRNFVEPFDLSYPPLLRIGIVKIAEKKYIFVRDMHHIISDGISTDLFLKEFMVLYEGEKLLEIKLQYKDYAVWQKGHNQHETIKKQEKYWLKVFEDQIPVLNLPTDYIRPGIQSFEGAVAYFTLDEEETNALKKLASAQDVTLYMVLLAVYYVFLSKLSGQEDIIVGTPVAGRRHADLHYIMGNFVNTLALRNYPVKEKNFSQLLKEIKETTLKAFENQDFQFEDLIEKLELKKDTSKNPLFDVLFVLQLQMSESYSVNIPEVKIPNFKLTPYKYENKISKFDLRLEINEVNGRLLSMFEYCTKLFGKKTPERFINYFKKIVNFILKEAAIKLWQIEIISETEKRRLLYDFNDTGCQYSLDKTLHQLFAKQVERTPDQVALVGKEKRNRETVQLTYRELNHRVNQSAHLLGQKGVQTNTIVGIIVKRSIEMVIGILGILKANGAYLPIEPGYPEERIHYMLTDSSAKVLVTTRDLSEKTVFEKDIVYLEDYKRLPPSTGHRAPGTGRRVTGLAYVIYTSGTTGRPKGVIISHRSAANTLSALHKKYPFMEGDTYLLKTSYVFDVSITELFGWFLGDGRLAVLEKNGEKDPRVIVKTIWREFVSHINFVPSMFRAFVEVLNTQTELIGCLTSLKYIFLAGEALSSDMISKFRELNPEIALENIYGPTEAAVYASWYSLADWNGSDHIPIGKPLYNVKLYILDGYHRVQPPGILGELCISGEGIARGYLNQPELTAERFERAVISHSSLVISSSLKANDKLSKSTNDQWPMTNDRSHKLFPNDSSSQYPNPPTSQYPITPSPHSPIYLTGDLARWLPDGNIEFFGRKDHQVKIRGFRIELEEIEVQLLKHKAVSEAIVRAINAGDGEKYLAAYIVPARAKVGKTPDISELRDYLQMQLPDYMVPSYFIPLEKMPLSPTGKVNRKMLPEFDGSIAGKLNTYAAPRNRIEEKIAGIWAEVLNLEKEKIGIDHSFFELGGHSLKAIKVISMIHKEFNIIISMMEFFRSSCIRKLSGCIKKEGKNKYISLEAAEKKEFYSLSSAQKRFYILQKMEVDTCLYNLPLLVEVGGELEIEKFEEVFRKLFKRHEILRTSFNVIEGEPIQRVHDEVEFEIAHYKIENGVKVEEIINNFIRAFDLSRPPLMKAGLIKTGKNKHILMVDMHHIITDAVSNVLLVRDFMTIFSKGLLPTLPLQYKGYSQWQNSQKKSEELKPQENYWLMEFAGDIPVLELPTDYPRPDRLGFEGSVVNFEITGEESSLLKQIAIEEEVTLYVILLALFILLLAKISDQEDIVIGIVTTGRSHLELEQLLGVFINTMALRSFPSKEKSFKYFLGEVKQKALESFDNQDYQFDDLVEKIGVREGNRSPLFDVIFGFLNMEDLLSNERIPGLTFKTYNCTLNRSRFDIVFTASEVENKLSFTFEYRTKLFKQETIEKFIRYFKNIITNVLEDPQKKIKNIEAMSEEEKKKIYSRIRKYEKDIHIEFDM